jgi:SAM-dependent methyltransferase
MFERQPGVGGEAKTPMRAFQKKTDADRPTQRVLEFGRRLFVSLKRTPLHPQWIAFKDEGSQLRAVAGLLHGRVLEIGSGERRLEKHLGGCIRYIGLDYPPSGQRYGASPDVWGDAACLPFREGSMDRVVLLEVLEHLPEPQTALREAGRVAAPGGWVLLSFPFLYPIHDAPYDFSRFTQFGLQQMAAGAGLEIIRLTERGGAAEAAALLASLALAKTAVQSIGRPGLTALAALPLLLLVPLINVVGWFLSRIIPVKQFMPTGYVAVLRKKD